MGFFSELKEDLSQAVSELVPDEEVVEETVQEVAVEEEAVMEEVAEEIVEEEVEEVVYQPAEEVVTPVAPVVSAPAYHPTEKVEFTLGEASDSVDEVATVTKRMTIKGDLESDGSLDLIGSIQGNLKIRGKLNITGTIIGNSEAAEVYAQEAKVTGDVTSRGSVKIGNNSVIRGNIYATSAVIAGAVKGDIDVKGPVILDSSAIVMGNIKSKSVQINNGAVIEGLCSQCYADVSPSAFFKD